MHCQWKLINVLKEQIMTEGHEKLAQAGASKKKIDKAMMKFLMNVEKQKSDWKKNFIHENDENIEISDNENQIEIFSDKEFEKESENEKAEI